MIDRDDRDGKHMVRSFAAASVLVVLAVTAGCNAPAPAWMPDPLGVFPPRTDTIPGLVTPREQVKQLRELRRRIAKEPPERQEQIARDLLEAYGREADPILRYEMVRVAAACSADSARRLIAAALEDDDTDVRVAACEVLGRWGDAQAVAQLQAVLGSDTDVNVRLAATRALGQTGAEGAVVALAEALEDRDPALQFVAVQSLEKLTGKDFGNDVNQWRQFVHSRIPQSPQPRSLAERVGRTY